MKCIIAECFTRASYSLPGKKPTHCVTHKTAEMVDVVNKRCQHPGCDTRPSYGIPGNSPTRCSTHRQPGMIRRSKSRCKLCKETAIYGKDWIPLHCEDHKQEDDINYLERPCISCGLFYILDDAGHCEICDPAKFISARLAKQKALMDYLDGRGLHGSSTDKILDGGICGKERPDRVFDFPTMRLIIECDEHQHMDRPCLCEQTRMVNIAQSGGGIPTYFLRWNPDDYDSGRKLPESLEKRHKLAADLIRDIQKKRHVPPPALCAAIYLYYDCWNGLATAEWQILTPLDA